MDLGDFVEVAVVLFDDVGNVPPFGVDPLPYEVNGSLAIVVRPGSSADRWICHCAGIRIFEFHERALVLIQNGYGRVPADPEKALKTYRWVF